MTSPDRTKSALPTSTSTDSPVQSVDRAFRVLEALLEVPDPQSTLNLARLTGLNRTVVHRLLKTLEGHGYVVSCGDGRYELGSQTLLPAATYLERYPLRRIALPYLVELAKTVSPEQPTVISLSVPVSSQVVIVERVWNPSGSLRDLPKLRSRIPLTGCSHGRVMLAGMPEAQARASIGDHAYSEFAQKLEEIRKSKLVETAPSQISPWITSAAGAVVDADGYTLACVSVSGPHEVFEDDTKIASNVLGTARALSASLIP